MSVTTYIQLEQEQLNNLLKEAVSVGVNAFIKEANKKEMLTTGDCAREYNCTIPTIKSYIRTGRLVAIQVVKNHRISRYEFNKFLKKHKAV